MRVKTILIFVLTFFQINLLFSLEVSFSVVGDIMSHDLQISTAYNSECDCWDYKFCFENVKPYLESTDITIGNLETTLPGDRKLFSGYPQFGTPDELIDALLWSGFNFLTLANNHSVDKGLSGIKRTRMIVEKKGIIPLGTFYSGDHFEKNFVTFYKKNQIVFAFLNFTYGTNGIPVPYPTVINQINLEELRNQIEFAKKQSPDVIILLLHYGKEYQTSPNTYQKLIVNLALKEGVDIVLGGHPHVLQPFEKFNLKDKYGIEKERLIVWSLGNFVSNQLKENTDGGMIFQFKIKKEEQKIKIFDLDYIPVYVNFNKKHYILPIHEYLYLSKEKKSMDLINLENKTYYIHSFHQQENFNKFKMIRFLKNTIKILNILPKRIQIQ